MTSLYWNLVYVFSFTIDGIIILFLFSASKHEPDGRVILVEFETLRLLNTYVPNNGWKEEENSFQRRRKWDKRILEFVTQYSDKPLIWCGDLNVRWPISIFQFSNFFFWVWVCSMVILYPICVAIDFCLL